MRKRIGWMGLGLGLAWATGVVGQAVPAGTGLVAYWTLNETTGTTAFDTAGSAPASDGQYVTGSPPTTDTAVPMVGGFAHPPGNAASRLFTQATSQQMVDVPSASDLNLTSAFTLAAWVRPTAANTNQFGIIERWSGQDNNPAINGYFLRLSSTMIPRVATGDGANQVGLDAGSGALTGGAWAHLAFTFEAGTIRLYVNGGAPTLANGAPTPGSNSANLHIGVDYGANRFDGNIDDVRIYNRRLSDTEVGILANGLTTPAITSLTPGPGTITVQWGAVTNATSYQILRGTSVNGPWTPVGTSTTTSFTDQNLMPPTPYWYRVVAVNLIESNPSAAFGSAVALPLVPRTKDHEEGFNDGNCACGSTVGRPAPLALLLLAALPLLFRRRPS